VKTVPDSYFRHDHYRFSLLANPTKKVGGKRLALASSDDLAAWMGRKAAAGGFIVEAGTLRLIPHGCEYFQKTGFRGTHAVVEFQGVLTVIDREQFRATVANGIGSAKAFGFGMLTVSPVSPC
jgi:CRISPR system Cascade subunit CasE